MGLNSLTMKKRLLLTVRAALGDGAFEILPRSFAVPEETGDWLRWLKGHKKQDTGDKALTHREAVRVACLCDGSTHQITYRTHVMCKHGRALQRPWRVWL